MDASTLSSTLASPLLPSFLDSSSLCHIFKTLLLSILVNLNSVVVWVDSTLPLISNSSSLFIKSFETVSNAPTTIGITVTLMFHSFVFQFSDKDLLCVYIFAFLVLVLSKVLVIVPAFSYFVFHNVNSHVYLIFFQSYLRIMITCY